MRTDTILRIEAMDALIEALGHVDAERFISMVKRESFDYTEWQRDLWKNRTIDAIHTAASEYERQQEAQTAQSASV